MVSILSTNFIQLIRQLIIILCRRDISIIVAKQLFVRWDWVFPSVQIRPRKESLNINALTSTVAVAKCKRKNKGELANTGPMNNGIRLV